MLGSRGRGGFASLLLGSNGMAAARDAECPVVVVPRAAGDVRGETSGGPRSRVVVGLKVDGPDEATLEFAFAEAARRGARLQAVAAYPWPAQPWMMPGEMPPPVVDQDVIEDEARVLAEGFLAPYRERHPDVPAEPLAAAGDAAGQIEDQHLPPASPPAVPGRFRRGGRWRRLDRRHARIGDRPRSPRRHPAVARASGRLGRRGHGSSEHHEGCRSASAACQ